MTARPFVPCQACDAENRIVSRSAEMAHYERRAEAAFDDEALCGAKFGSKWLVPKLCLLRYLNRREDGGENDEDAQMRQARGSR